MQQGYQKYENAGQLADLLVREDAGLFVIVLTSTFAHSRGLFVELRKELHEHLQCDHAKLLVSQGELRVAYQSNTVLFRSAATSQDSLRGMHASHVIDATFPQTEQQQEERLQALHLVLLPMLRA